jgi:hypothetical protein
LRESFLGELPAPQHVERIDWGCGGPNELITLNALRFLAAS